MTQDDLLGFLQQTEVDVQNIDIGYSDPGMLETHIKQLQVCTFKFLSTILTNLY